MRFEDKKVVMTGGTGGIGQVMVIDGGRTSKLPLPF